MLQPVKKSTTSLGRAFERHCLAVLGQQLGMDLLHVGGKGDGGVDLRGWWRIPRDTSVEEMDSGDARMKSGDRRRIRVLVQCKAEKLKSGPRLIRELEGTWRQATSESIALDPYHLTPSSSNTSTILNPSNICVAIACTASGFSTAAAKDLARSSIPMLLLHIPLAGMTPDVVLDHEGTDPSAPMDIADSEKSILASYRAVDSTSSDPDTQHPPPHPHTTIFGALWNRALISSTGILGNGFELRHVLETGVEERSTSRPMSESDGGLFGLRLFFHGKELNSDGQRG